MRELICPECGLVLLPTGVTLCPTCGLTALDPTNPDHADAIEEAVRLRQELMTPRWFYAVLALTFIPIVFGSVYVTQAQAGTLVGLLLYLAVAYALQRLLRHRLTPQWQDAIERSVSQADRGLRWRIWTSTSVIALALNLIVAAITPLVGTDALHYQRGAEPWRIVTATFTHGGFVHLGGNMLALFAFGIPIDLRVGRLATAAILAIGAVVGAIAQAHYFPDPMIGFSAAIYGLIGATLALMPTRPTMLIMQGIAIPLPTWAWSMIMIPLFTFTAWVDQGSHVGWIAHLGGFIGGFLVGLPMRMIAPTPWFERFELRRAKRLERLASR